MFSLHSHAQQKRKHSFLDGNVVLRLPLHFLAPVSTESNARHPLGTRLSFWGSCCPVSSAEHMHIKSNDLKSINTNQLHPSHLPRSMPVRLPSTVGYHFSHASAFSNALLSLQRQTRIRVSLVARSSRTETCCWYRPAVVHAFGCGSDLLITNLYFEPMRFVDCMTEYSVRLVHIVSSTSSLVLLCHANAVSIFRLDSKGETDRRAGKT